MRFSAHKTFHAGSVQICVSEIKINPRKNVKKRGGKCWKDMKADNI